MSALESPDGFEHMHGLPDDEVVKGDGRPARGRQLDRSVGAWSAHWRGRTGSRLATWRSVRTVASLYFDGAEINDEELLEFSRRWSPWRSYATSYLFAALRAGRVAGS